MSTSLDFFGDTAFDHCSTGVRHAAGLLSADQLPQPLAGTATPSDDGCGCATPAGPRELMMSEPGRGVEDAHRRTSTEGKPTPRFDAACTLAVAHLNRVAPSGTWAITRVVNDRQFIVAIEAPSDDIVAGAHVPFTDSLCWFMESSAPPMPPRVEAVADSAAEAPLAPFDARAYLGVPITRPGGGLFGMVCGYDPHIRTDYSQDHRHVLELVSGMLSAVLEADTVASTVVRDLESAHRDAHTDPLTGLLNRRGWDNSLLVAERHLRRSGQDACVIVVDLDHLKAVNDTGGHAAGDHHICRAARALASSVRTGDVVARLGGDEFGILAVDASPAQADELVARLNDALHRAGIEACAAHAPYYRALGFPAAWSTADRAMYLRKRHKYNCSTPVPTAPIPADPHRRGTSSGESPTTYPRLRGILDYE
jgi:diguanylate cyclase (GGDEF)-like protein